MQNDFEELLSRNIEAAEKIKRNEYNQIKNGVYDSPDPLKSDRAASLFDFIKMVDKLVTLTMKDLGVKFIPDEGKIIPLKTDNPLDSPLITYKLINRKTKGELKPRLREMFQKKNEYDDVEVGEVYGQKFVCHVQFNIFASVYTTAEQVMEKFEEIMIAYAGYFKRNGVVELMFDNQFTDEAFETARQTLSIRNLRYYVEIEKLTVIMRESIKAIETHQLD